MMRRRGPGAGPIGPGGGMGGMAPPGGGAPGGAPGAGGDIGQVIGKLLADMKAGQTAQSDYVTKVVENMKRTAAVMVAKLDMSHPEVARHMSRAWSSLDAALKAAKQAQDNRQSLAQGPLGFTGAGAGTGQEPQGPMPGQMPAPGPMRVAA
jgi:hypothetical protein